MDFYAKGVTLRVARFSCFQDAVYQSDRSSPSELECMKSQRHSAIRELLVKATVTNQDELRRKLASRGIHVTQATLSRDIRELKLMKGPTGYALPVVLDGEDDLPEIASVLQDFGLEVRQAQNLLIVLTTMGGAQPVAASIDSEDWEEVVGTIAGDNTVLIICPDNRKAEVLRTRIEAYVA
jgi:transcriptional regulator of arginine metabolism